MRHGDREAPETWSERLERRAFLWLLRDRPNKLVDGLWIGTFDGHADLLPRVEDALALIKSCDPLRYDRLVRDLDRILVRLVFHGNACFDPKLNACSLDPRFVSAEASSIDVIAAAIVHEATHARLWRKGIRYEQGIRHRVEAICFRRELAFANKLPHPQVAQEGAKSYLAAYGRLIAGRMLSLRSSLWRAGWRRCAT
jgi:hypothetical protein